MPGVHGSAGCKTSPASTATERRRASCIGAGGDSFSADRLPLCAATRLQPSCRPESLPNGARGL